MLSPEGVGDKDLAHDKEGVEAEAQVEHGGEHHAHVLELRHQRNEEEAAGHDAAHGEEGPLRAVAVGERAEDEAHDDGRHGVDADGGRRRGGVEAEGDEEGLEVGDHAAYGQGGQADSHHKHPELGGMQGLSAGEAGLRGGGDAPAGAGGCRLSRLATSGARAPCRHRGAGPRPRARG